jgi:hypothetical protein
MRPKLKAPIPPKMFGLMSSIARVSPNRSTTVNQKMALYSQIFDALSECSVSSIPTCVSDSDSEPNREKVRLALSTRSVKKYL